MYHAVAKLPDGTEISTEGNLKECAAWADQIIREQVGGIQISIIRKE